ncbi:hypothetical protein C8F04DRAFT_1190922 [Mycena alexandri]|uniref:JmjC domain-containing protein n=1 Tax=Mycena alexandri TaxID=1745969 RepID=A0AAD6WSY3_9AGAR|nr:hypothetical protein C8F04DRAFT_1190922 [Mycena alexandri]
MYESKRGLDLAETGIRDDHPSKPKRRRRNHGFGGECACFDSESDGDSDQVQMKETGALYGFYFQEHEIAPYPIGWRNQWNKQLEKHHIDETKAKPDHDDTRTSANPDQIGNNCVCVTVPTSGGIAGHKLTSNTCWTSVFTGSWMCLSCGREACAECFERIKSLSVGVEANILPASQHHAHNFRRTTNFGRQELIESITDMDRILSSSPALSLSPALSSFGFSASDLKSSTPNVLPIHEQERDANLVPSHEQERDADLVPSHEIRQFTNTSLTEERFRLAWACSKPLLVTDVGQQLKLPWTPKFFIEKYGATKCLISECQTDQTKCTNVAAFFKTFGEQTARKGSWKLKRQDWPPASDFQAMFPELYDDFSQAVPMPSYTRRDGVLNLASHFPLNAVAPDLGIATYLIYDRDIIMHSLGPKMYNAHANLEESSCQGSTRLHMDMADAVNLMTYAAPDSDGAPGCAAWDLFEADDSDKLRKFLQHEFAIEEGDPIHSQQVYLDDAARRRLWREYGVKSYRVYQTAGQAVFIPAGCAHQVRNLADCIKVAIDFVSPENIRRCEQLTQEFREQNHARAWKEDVLQLRTMMWFAWKSCSHQEKMRAHYGTGVRDENMAEAPIDSDRDTPATAFRLPLPILTLASAFGRCCKPGTAFKRRSKGKARRQRDEGWTGAGSPTAFRLPLFSRFPFRQKPLGVQMP